jgi:Protein of unknown function (DUF1559)
VRFQSFSPALIITIMNRRDIICFVVLLGGIGLMFLTGAFDSIFPGEIRHRGRLPTANNLKMIGLAFHNYADYNKCFPSAAIQDKDGQPLLSWRVALLPFLEESDLYSQFRLDEPWDSPNNKPLLTRIPKVYAPPSGKPPQEPFGTFYQVFVGPGAAFEDQSRIDFRSFTDGTSQTILAIEAAEPVPWTKPEDLQFMPDGPLPKLGGHSKYGAHCVYVDGSVRQLPKETDERILRALINRNGGEKLGNDEHGNWCIRPEPN